MKLKRVLCAMIILLVATITLSSCTTFLTTGTCGKNGDNLRWSFGNDGVLTITGIGEMKDYSFESPAPWNKYQDSITQINLSAGIESIGQQAFWECRKLTSVKFSDELISIGDAAFCGCTGLTNAILPTRIKTIGKWAYEDCDNLTSISFPEGLDYVGEYAFAYCHSLTAALLPESLKIIREGVFKYCSCLTELSFPTELQSIGDRAFQMCGNLAELSLPHNLISIGDYAFTECGFSEITIPDRVAVIGANPFAGCIQLKTITVSPQSYYLTVEEGVLFSNLDRRLICCPCTLERESYVVPDGTKIVGDSAFFECGKLHELSLPDSVTFIGTDAFFACVLRFSVGTGSFAEQYCKERGLNYSCIDNYDSL